MSVPTPVAHQQNTATVCESGSFWQVPDAHKHPVPFEIWEKIIKCHWDPFKAKAKDIVKLTALSTQFNDLFRPFMYRHVNLRTLGDAACFFSTVANESHASLAVAVKTLQFSFDLDPSAAAPLAVPPSQSAWTDFWAKFRRALPRLLRLKTLSVSYAYDDTFFLHRLVLEGDLADYLPDSVQTLHLKPLHYDIYNVIEVYDNNPFSSIFSKGHQDPDSAGPWDDPSWRLSIALIPHIHTLIVSSSLYVVWPPTEKEAELCLTACTAQLRHVSRPNLKTIVVNCAYGNEGALLEDWEEEHDFLSPLFELKEVNGGVGMQLVATEVSTKKWEWKTLRKPSSSYREEYFFGWEGREYLVPWLHINEVQNAKKRQRSNKSLPRIWNDYGVVY
ncbi:hypothetical protein DFH06DRAFT_1121476 [Mycena polygramma]|nr:hypothetical protein DFH06DRAFT_1121476 [Mycena polygramma]